jgi:hypothetical protein
VLCCGVAGVGCRNAMLYHFPYFGYEVNPVKESVEYFSIFRTDSYSPKVITRYVGSLFCLHL